MTPILIISIVIIGFIVVIIGLIIVLKKSPQKETVTIQKAKLKNDKFDLDDLMDIVKNAGTSSSEVLDALIYFNENFKIDKKNSKKCFLFLSRALTHPNKNKNIFQYFHNEIKPKNINFKNTLESIEKTALS